MAKAEKKNPLLWHQKLHIKNTAAREFLAEFMGTFILVLFGDGVVAQVVLSDSLGDPKGSFFTINWGWGVAVTLGVLTAGGVSGAHINPAVTTALALVGKFDWKKMFHYIAAQYLGAFMGAVFVYLTYFEAFQAYKDSGFGTNGFDQNGAGIFATYPQPFLSTGGGFFDQCVGTGLLLFCVLAITDSKNMKVKSSLVPLYIGFIVLNIGICFGYNCGYAINPARDLGPRIFTAMAGWGGEVFTASSAWAWVPVIAGHLGATVGAFLYCFTIENHWPKDEELELNADQEAEKVEA